ncbi:MAG: gamma-glutamyltransferase family protein [Planctomycetes bacterium]|nr:gamma-glutamyltransferase family protein [Planctomycetota bacterium]
MNAEGIQPGRGLVAAPQAEAAYEGARVLTAGGNAADALVTAAFVQGVVDPHRCGIGGFGCATLFFYEAAGGPGRSLCVDFHGRAGSLARPDVWADLFEDETPDGFGYLVKDKVNDVGYQAITVPGMVAGVAEIHSRFGRMPWGELIERAIPYAENGFRVTPELENFWIRPGLHGRVSTRDRLGHTEVGREICFKEDGESYQAGEIFRQPRLAETYRRLANEGAESYYRGALAREIAEDWQANGALVTLDDLQGYAPTIREPLSGSFRGYEVLSTPLPGGGVALLQTLALMERRLAGSVPLHNSPAYIEDYADILKRVWSDRLANQGDTAFGTAADETFLTEEYLDALAERESPQGGADCPDTTQLTIVDRDGNSISFAHSLGYNSGVFSPGLGILFNNCMSAFDPRPGDANSIAAGKARSTAVAETIVLEEGKPKLVLGSPGAARITAGISQVILNVTVFGMNVAEAVVHPRFDAYSDNTLLLESRFPAEVVAALAGGGWEIIHSPNPFGVVGRVYAAEISSRDPLEVIAGVDPGASGAAYREVPEE